MELRVRCGYSLGVGGVVLSGGRVLLVRRLHEPNRGRWTFPSGYVNAEESVEQAAVREVAEETGVRAEVVGVVGLRNRVSPNDNNLVLFFLMYPREGEPVADGVEVDDARYFTFAEALANADAIELNKMVIRKVMAGGGLFLPTDCPPTPGLAALRYVAFL